MIFYFDEKIKQECIKLIEGITAGFAKNEKNRYASKGEIIFGNNKIKFSPKYLSNENENYIEGKIKIGNLYLESRYIDFDFSEINNDVLDNFFNTFIKLNIDLKKEVENGEFKLKKDGVKFLPMPEIDCEKILEECCKNSTLNKYYREKDIQFKKYLGWIIWLMVCYFVIEKEIEEVCKDEMKKERENEKDSENSENSGKNELIKVLMNNLIYKKKVFSMSYEVFIEKLKSIGDRREEYGKKYITQKLVDVFG